MEFRPIVSSLRHHRLIAVLLALLVAFTCAIVCNVAFMVARHAGRMHLESGVVENQLVYLQSFSMTHNANPVASHRTDLAALRKIPGGEAAAVVDTLPFTGNDWVTDVGTKPNPKHQVDVSIFSGTPGELETLGLKRVAGRDFHRNEYVPKDSRHGYDGIHHVTAAIITRSLAERLFPEQKALGQLIYPADHGIRVVGIVQQLLRPGAGYGPDNNFSLILPMLPDSSEVYYALRTRPQHRAQVIEQATDTLNRISHDRFVRGRTFTSLRADHFQRDRSMIRLLIAAALGLLLVTAIGIAGLGSFWVQQRTRTIGIRRAVGATRRDILRYFQTENALIVGVGIVLGVVLAVGINMVLMHFFELPRLPLWYLPVGAVVLWLLGQLAVLAPALRASNVPPVVATRSV